MRIPLHGRGGMVRGYAEVDDDAPAEITGRRWFLRADGYAAYSRYLGGGRAAQRQETVMMHRALLGLGPGDAEVDHRDGDRLNNRLSNLRTVTRSQNSQNQRSPWGRSRHRGVDFHKGKWRARVKVCGTTHEVGVFESEDEAGAAAAAFRAEHMPFSPEAEVAHG